MFQNFFNYDFEKDKKDGKTIKGKSNDNDNDKGQYLIIRKKSQIDD